MVRLTINGAPVEVPEGTTILHAARTAGVRIPTLCYVERLQAIGACRVCVVEIEGMINLASSCSMPVAEGMRVRTNTRRVRQARQLVVELLLSEHDGDCQTCDRREDCELQELSAELGIRTITYAGQKTRKRIDISTPGLMRDHGKCIKCRRCVSVCAETQHVGALGAGAGVRHGDRSGLQSRPEHRGLRTVRSVCRGLSRRGHHRAVAGRSRVGCDRRPAQTRGGADGPGHPRRFGRVFWLRAGHSGHRQNDGCPPQAGIRFRIRHELRRGPDHRGRGHGTAHQTPTGAGRQAGCGPAHVHQLLARLDPVCRVLPPPDSPQPVDLQVAATDVRRPGENLLRRQARPEARTGLRHVGDALHGQEVRMSTARDVPPAADAMWTPCSPRASWAR